MNNAAKTLTVFLVVIAVLLVSLTTIAVFFFLKEVELRKVAQDNVEQLEDLKAKLQAENKQSKKEIFILQEKNKEAEDKIESLMEELELEQGLNEEIKKQNKELQAQMGDLAQRREELESKMEREKTQTEAQLNDLRQQLDKTLTANKELQQTVDEYEQQMADQAGPPTSAPAPESQPEVLTQETPPPPVEEVELDKIVVTPTDIQATGAIIDVDRENEFIIVSLGEKHGLIKNVVLSIYRGDDYLGDVKVTQVLPDMSAADFIPPLTSKEVQQDDTVTVKGVSKE